MGYFFGRCFLLLHTARNGVFSSKPGGSKLLHFAGKDILWTNIMQLYDMECGSMLKKTRLMQSHNKLNSYSKVSIYDCSVFLM